MTLSLLLLAVAEWRHWRLRHLSLRIIVVILLHAVIIITLVSHYVITPLLIIITLNTITSGNGRRGSHCRLHLLLLLVYRWLIHTTSHYINIAITGHYWRHYCCFGDTPLSWLLVINTPLFTTLPGMASCGWSLLFINTTLLLITLTTPLSLILIGFRHIAIV